MKRSTLFTLLLTPLLFTACMDETTNTDACVAKGYENGYSLSSCYDDANSAECQQEADNTFTVSLQTNKSCKELGIDIVINGLTTESGKQVYVDNQELADYMNGNNNQ